MTTRETARPPIDTVLDADTERASLLNEAEALESPDYDGDPMRIAGLHEDENVKPCDQRVVMQ